MTARVDVQIAVDDESVPPKNEIALWITRAVAAAGQSADAEVSVRVVAAEEMRRLNCDFRQKDRSTNVLAFPAGEIAGLPHDAGRPLGDIVVCAPVVSDEAGQQGKPIRDHWAHMLVHGVLHLLGYDHVDETGAEAMERLEARILGDYGIANPYGESPPET